MSKFKAGDRVRCIDEVSGSPHFGKKGDIAVVEKRLSDSTFKGTFENATSPQHMSDSRFELVAGKPKGTFENLIVESLPQGGYTVTAPGRAWGNQPTPLAAFTTADEALKFIGENIK
jgi:hypothetical protein